MKTPKVSVIIPVHNVAKYLARCIDSVCAQTFSDLEIILVENASTDASPELCDEYAEKDKRIRVLHLENADVSVARNKGVEISTAPYITFADSDDYVEPDMVRQLLEALEANNADLAYCNNDIEFDDGVQPSFDPYPNSGKTMLRSPREVVFDILYDEKVSNGVHTKLYRRSIVEALPLPENMFLEDYATVYKWAASCERIVWVDKCFYHYVQRNNSIMHSMDAKKRYDFFRADCQRLEFLYKSKLFEGEELHLLVNTIVSRCFHRLDVYIKEVGYFSHRQQTKHVRRLLKDALWFEDLLPARVCKHIRQINSIWPVYYWIHYGRKK